LKKVLHGKPLSNGSYIKELWLECAEFLFDYFPGKGKIIQRINDLPVTRNAVKDKILKRKQTTFLCICPDKNTDFE
jgi:hypothetical protein